MENVSQNYGMKEREPRMKVLISEKSKQRFKFGAIVMIFLALIVLFVVQYQIVNGKALHHVKHEVIPYGENYEMADITYNIQKSPVWRKIYDEDYRMKIYKYETKVTVVNHSDKTVSIYDIVPNYCLLSGGSIWYGNVQTTEKDSIDSGDKVTLNLFFDVIPEEGMQASIYETAALYYVMREKGRTYKIEYKRFSAFV